MNCRWIVVCVGVLLLAAPRLAAECPELVGQLPGSSCEVAVSGDYAYLGSLSGLIVADVSDPSTPWVVGEVGMPYLPLDIAASGGYASVTRPTASSRVAFAPQQRSALTGDHVG